MKKSDFLICENEHETYYWLMALRELGAEPEQKREKQKKKLWKFREQNKRVKQPAHNRTVDAPSFDLRKREITV